MPSIDQKHLQLHRTRCIDIQWLPVGVSDAVANQREKGESQPARKTVTDLA